MKGVCFFGDGLVQGRGDQPGTNGLSGWPGLLVANERRRGRAFTPFTLGVPGETSTCLLARWQHEAALRAPACDDDMGLVFCFGREDMSDTAEDGVRVPLMESVTNAEAIMTIARPHWPVLWVGPTPIRPRPGLPLAGRPGRRFSATRARLYNEAYRAIAEKLFIPYLDLFALFEEDATWAAALRDGDGVHPAEPGLAQVATAVQRWPAWRDWMEDMGGIVLPRPPAMRWDTPERRTA